MSNRIRHTRIAVLALMLAGMTGNALADVVVIVSASSQVGSLSSEQASDVFLGRANNLTPIDQTDGSAVREEFYTKVTGKTGDQVRAYWARQVFTGKGQPPKSVANDAAVKSAVAGNPSAVGYVSSGAVDSTVKVVLTVH